MFDNNERMELLVRTTTDWKKNKECSGVETTVNVKRYRMSCLCFGPQCSETAA